MGEEEEPDEEWGGKRSRKSSKKRKASSRESGRKKRRKADESASEEEDANESVSTPRARGGRGTKARAKAASPKPAKEDAIFIGKGGEQMPTVAEVCESFG